MNEELIKELNKLMDIFFNQEAGNRLSEFAWIAFRNEVIAIINKYKENIEKINE